MNENIPGLESLGLLDRMDLLCGYLCDYTTFHQRQTIYSLLDELFVSYKSEFGMEHYLNGGVGGLEQQVLKDGIMSRQSSLASFKGARLIENRGGK